MAYSLMGLFNVNMPMLYGEGEKAFMRLQEEIIRHSDDPSIFAWSGVKPGGSGLLASSLASFSDPDKVTSPLPLSTSIERQPWSMTNQGLHIELWITPWAGGIYMARLDCQSEAVERQNIKHVIGVFLEKVGANQYRRMLTDYGDLLLEPHFKYLPENRNFQKMWVYVRQDELSSHTYQQSSYHSSKGLPIYGVKLLPIDGIDLAACVDAPGKWDASSGVAEFEPGQFGPVASIDLTPFAKSLGIIRIGLDFDFRPRIVMARNSALAFRSQMSRDVGSILSVWDVGFNHKTAWDVECFAVNPWPARGRFEGAIDDEKYEDIFIYSVPRDQKSCLIHVMHRVGSSGSRVLVAELTVRRTVAQGRPIWSIGVMLFPSAGASVEDTASVLDSWKSDDRSVDTLAGHQSMYNHLRQYVGRLARDRPPPNLKPSPQQGSEESGSPRGVTNT